MNVIYLFILFYVTSVYLYNIPYTEDGMRIIDVKDVDDESKITRGYHVRLVLQRATLYTRKRKANGERKEE